MTQRVTELIVDARKAVAGSNEAIAALDRLEAALKDVAGAENQAGKAGEGLGRTFHEEANNAGRLERAMRGLERAHEPLITATRQHEQALKQLDAAERQGVRTAEQIAALRQREVAAFNAKVKAIRDAQNATQQHTGAVQLQTHQLVNLSQQLQDVVVGLGSGQRAFTVLLQQGPQIVSSVGGMSNAWRLLTGLITPATVAMTAAAAGLVALGVGLSRAESEARGLNAVETGFRATGRAALLSRDQIQALIDSTARIPGVSREAAVATATEFSRARQIGGAMMQQLSSIVGDFALATGQEVPDAAKELAKAFADPIAGAKALDDQFGLLTLSQAQAINALVASGDKVGAQQALYKALEDRMKGLREQGMTAVEKGADSVGKAWDNMLAAFGRTSTIQGARAALIDFFGFLGGLADGGQPGGAPKPPMSYEEQADIMTRSGLPVSADELRRQDERTRRNLTRGVSPISSDPFADIGAGPVYAGANARGAGGGTGGTSKAAITETIAKYDELAKRREQYVTDINKLIEAGALEAGVHSDLYKALERAQAGYASVKDAVTLATEASQREAAVLAAPIEQRDILRARLEAEANARNQGKTAAEAAALGDIAAAQAANKLGAAARDKVVEITRETAGLQRLAAAQSQGTAAVAAAERQNKIDAATAGLQGNAREAVAAAIGQQIDAQRALNIEQGKANLDAQIADLERLADAYSKGAAAIREAEIANQVAAFSRQNPTATPQDLAYVDERIRKEKDLNAVLENRKQILAGGDQLALLQRELALVSELPEIRARELERLRVIQELNRQGIALTSEEAQQRLRIADAIGMAKGQLEAAYRQQELFDEAVKGVARTIDQTLTTAMKRVLDGGGVEAWKDLFLDAIKEIAVQLTQLYLIRPLLGSGLSALGLDRVARDLGYSTGGSGVSTRDLISGGSSVYRLIGSPALDSLSFGGVFSTGALTGGIGGGAIPAAAAGSPAFLGGTTSLAGAEGLLPFTFAEALPYVGAAVAAFTLLSSLFKDKPQSHHAAVAGFIEGRGTFDITHDPALRNDRATGEQIRIAQDMGRTLTTFVSDLSTRFGADLDALVGFSTRFDDENQTPVTKLLYDTSKTRRPGKDQPEGLTFNASDPAATADAFAKLSIILLDTAESFDDASKAGEKTQQIIDILASDLDKVTAAGNDAAFALGGYLDKQWDAAQVALAAGNNVDAIRASFDTMIGAAKSLNETTGEATFSIEDLTAQQNSAINVATHFGYALDLIGGNAENAVPRLQEAGAVIMSLGESAGILQGIGRSLASFGKNAASPSGIGGLLAAYPNTTGLYEVDPIASAIQRAIGDLTRSAPWDDANAGPTALAPGNALMIQLLSAALPGRASGGPARGLFKVGESGEEIVWAPGGAHVFSNAQSRRMMGAGLPGYASGTAGLPGTHGIEAALAIAAALQGPKVFYPEGGKVHALTAPGVNELIRKVLLSGDPKFMTAALQSGLLTGRESIVPDVTGIYTPELGVADPRAKRPVDFFETLNFGRLHPDVRRYIGTPWDATGANPYLDAQGRVVLPGVSLLNRDVAVAQARQSLAAQGMPWRGAGGTLPRISAPLYAQARAVRDAYARFGTIDEGDLEARLAAQEEARRERARAAIEHRFYNDATERPDSHRTIPGRKEFVKRDAAEFERALDSGGAGLSAGDVSAILAELRRQTSVFEKIERNMTGPAGGIPTSRR